MSLSYIGCNQLIDWLASVLPKKVRWVGGRIQIVRTFCKKKRKIHVVSRLPKIFC